MKTWVARSCSRFVRMGSTCSRWSGGQRGQPGATQLAFATASGRVLVTRNVSDFAVHRGDADEWAHQASIIAISRQRFAAGLHAAALARLAARFTPEETTGGMKYLSNWR